jgi:hypothetical protein
MTTFGHTGLFGTPEARKAEHLRLVGDVVAHAESGSDAKAAEVQRVRRALMEFLRRVGVTFDFQAIDFTAWLAETNAMPDPALFDARGIGGLFVALRRAGIIEQLCYRPTGGCVARNINSAMRPAYVVRSLDFAALGWEGA